MPLAARASSKIQGPSTQELPNGPPRWQNGRQTKKLKVQTRRGVGVQKFDAVPSLIGSLTPGRSERSDGLLDCRDTHGPRSGGRPQNYPGSSQSGLGCCLRNGRSDHPCLLRGKTCPLKTCTLTAPLRKCEKCGCVVVWGRLDFPIGAATAARPSKAVASLQALPQLRVPLGDHRRLSRECQTSYGKVWLR